MNFEHKLQSYWNGDGIIWKCKLCNEEINYDDEIKNIS